MNNSHNLKSRQAAGNYHNQISKNHDNPNFRSYFHNGMLWGCEFGDKHIRFEDRLDDIVRYRSIWLEIKIFSWAQAQLNNL